MFQPLCCNSKYRRPEDHGEAETAIKLVKRARNSAVGMPVPEVVGEVSHHNQDCDFRATYLV